MFQAYPSPKPVTNLFPWHEPRVRTEKLDLFKVMQQIYDNTQSNYMKNMLENLDLSFSSFELKNIENRLSQGTNLVKLDFQRFYLITNVTRPGTNASHYKEPLAPLCSQKTTNTNNSPCTVGVLNHKPRFPPFLMQRVSSSENAILNIVDKQSTNRKSHKIGDMSKLYAKNTIVTTPRTTKRSTKHLSHVS